MKENILFQLEMTWQLYLYHLDNLEDEEALWALSPKSMQVYKENEGWKTTWPETESYEMGPSSIAWTLWHIIYWWSTALDANFGEGTLEREDVLWPGSVEKARERINELHDQWIVKLNSLSEAEFSSSKYSKWPLEGQNFTNTALWLNAELMKNTAEIGYGRFLYESTDKEA